MPPRDRILARRAQFLAAAMLSAGCSSTTPQVCLSPKCDDACNGPIDAGTEAGADAPADAADAKDAEKDGD